MNTWTSPANLGRHRDQLIFFPYVLRETRFNPLGISREKKKGEGVGGRE